MRSFERNKNTKAEREIQKKIDIDFDPPLTASLA